MREKSHPPQELSAANFSGIERSDLIVYRDVIELLRRRNALLDVMITIDARLDRLASRIHPETDEDEQTIFSYVQKQYATQVLDARKRLDAVLANNDTAIPGLRDLERMAYIDEMNGEEQQQRGHDFFGEEDVYIPGSFDNGIYETGLDRTKKQMVELEDKERAASALPWYRPEKFGMRKEVRQARSELHQTGIVTNEARSQAAEQVRATLTDAVLKGFEQEFAHLATLIDVLYKSIAAKHGPDPARQVQGERVLSRFIRSIRNPGNQENRIEAEDALAKLDGFFDIEKKNTEALGALRELRTEMKGDLAELDAQAKSISVLAKNFYPDKASDFGDQTSPFGKAVQKAIAAFESAGLAYKAVETKLDVAVATLKDPSTDSTERTALIEAVMHGMLRNVVAKEFFDAVSKARGQMNEAAEALKVSRVSLTHDTRVSADHLLSVPEKDLSEKPAKQEQTKRTEQREFPLEKVWKLDRALYGNWAPHPAGVLLQLGTPTLTLFYLQGKELYRGACTSWAAHPNSVLVDQGLGGLYLNGAHVYTGPAYDELRYHPDGFVIRHGNEVLLNGTELLGEIDPESMSGGRWTVEGKKIINATQQQNKVEVAGKKIMIPPNANWELYGDGVVVAQESISWDHKQVTYLFYNDRFVWAGDIEKWKIAPEGVMIMQKDKIDKNKVIWSLIRLPKNDEEISSESQKKPVHKNRNFENSLHTEGRKNIAQAKREMTEIPEREAKIIAEINKEMDPVNKPEEFVRQMTQFYAERSIHLYQVFLCQQIKNMSPEAKKHIEEEMAKGYIAILMPGRDAFWNSRNTLVEKFQPTCIQVGKKVDTKTSLADDYWKDFFSGNILDLQSDLPVDRYLMLVRPTNAPDLDTRNKTTKEQLEHFEMKQKEYKVQDKEIRVMGPVSYIVTQTWFTYIQQVLAKKAGIELREVSPLDRKTFTRFITLLLSDGDVPYGSFRPDNEQQRLGTDDANFQDPGSGYRIEMRKKL